MHVRDIVNVALEARRQDKTIGTSLGARVSSAPAARRARCSNSYRDELPMLFIVSQVDL